jgi:predicted Ser/Thr protein kinase
MQFKKGVSTIKVELGNWQGKPAVFKYLKTDSKYLRELSAYKQLVFCTFIPKLLASSIDDRVIVTQYVGQSLNLKYSPPERKKFKTQIQNMNHELAHVYGIHHNDIRWKNVVESDDGKLFLIDFESWTPFYLGSKERDPEKILS